MSNLDAEELLFLAIEAIRDKKREQGISYLKKSIEVQPSPMAQYLLSAEYAQLGMYPRAVESFMRTLEMQSDFWPARYQLALILMSMSEMEIALHTLEPMLDLPEENEFHYIGLGLSALINDEDEKAEVALLKAIQVNKTNPALNKDLERIIADIAADINDDTVGIKKWQKTLSANYEQASANSKEEF